MVSTSGEVGINSAEVCALSVNWSWPESTVEPCRSCTVTPVSVPPSIGSLKTITMIPLRGTSRLWAGGSVRITLGREEAGTWYQNSVGRPPRTDSMRVSMVSPACAASATGSNPPSTMMTTTLSLVRRFRTLVVRPSGSVPGGSDT